MTNSRDLNRARVFEVIHLYEPVSRTEIARHVGLTSAAISYIVSELIELGYVMELGRRAGVRGQPAIELGVSGNSACTLGLHFNHDRIRGAVVDLKGELVADVYQELPDYPAASLVLDTLIGVGRELKQSIPDGVLLGAGLASVGPIDLIEGCVTQTAFMQDWHNVALRQPLAEALQLPVCMDNNATAAAIGEYWYGGGRDYDNFLYVSFFRNGLGGGLFLNRRVYRGAGLNAAEFGHIVIQPAQALANVPPYLENHVSGYALKRDLGIESLADLPEMLTTGDQLLGDWLDNAGKLFAQAVVTVDHLLDLDAIIVGGEMPEELIQSLIHRASEHLDDLFMPGWSQPACLRQSQNCSNNTVLGAATLPIYDVFALNLQSAGSGANFFKSEAAGGSMH